jgi:hypothetical protein
MALEPVSYGPFRLDLDSGQFFSLNVPIGQPLTQIERKVLSVIMSLKGDVASYDVNPSRKYCFLRQIPI